MACVVPRAGSDTARTFRIAQGVPLFHGKMKQILVRLPLRRKYCRCSPPVLNVKNMTSEAVVIEEMEAIEASEASEKKTMRWQRWQAHETMTLIAAKKQQALRDVESIEAPGIESKKTKNKWKVVEAFCREKGIERSAQQCQARWFRLMSTFTQIRSWEETRKPGQPSFWSLKLDERKAMGFLLSLDQKTYNALDELHNSKIDAIKNTLVNVKEVAELESINRMPCGYEGKNYNANKAYVNFSPVQGKIHEVDKKTDLRTSGCKNDVIVNAECFNISKPNDKGNNESYARDADDDCLSGELEERAREKQVDQCKAMESTKILSEFLQIVVDDRKKAQLQHASAGKMDFYPTNMQTGQQAESLKNSGITDHTNPLILCDQKDVNDKAQLLPASAETIDGSNEDSCNKAQLLLASAENMDCNSTSLHTAQQIGCDQKDANDKAQLSPASANIDGSNKDSCERSQEECGAEGKTIVMHWDDVSFPSPHVMYDETMQAVKGEGIETSADGSLSKTNTSVIDSQLGGDIADANSVSASVEESCGCQKSKSHLSSSGVDALNVNETMQITGTSSSCISIDKEACKNYSVDRNLAETACNDKNEKGEGVFEVCKEGISTTSSDNIQSNFIEAQIKVDACEMGEDTMTQLNNVDPMIEEAYAESQMVLHTRFEKQKGDLNPLLASKEEINLGILNQGPEDNSRSRVFESICSHQGKDSEKIELRTSEEGHIKSIADMTEINTPMVECSFDKKKVEHLQNGNNEHNGKTSEPKHLEIGVKGMDTVVKREPCDWLQSVYDRDGHDTIEGMKVAIQEGDSLTAGREIRASTVDTNTPALTCIQHQFQHAGSTLEQKSTIKGDCGSFESVCEANREEVLKVAVEEPKELDFTIKDNRGSAVTSGKRNTEDQSQLTTTSSTADEDVFMYIPAATGNFVKSALQTIRKIFKF